MNPHSRKCAYLFPTPLAARPKTPQMHLRTVFQNCLFKCLSVDSQMNAEIAYVVTAKNSFPSFILDVFQLQKRQ